MMGRISIALCTYNGERYLAEQLASICQQTRLPDELIIYDDRSTDNTILIAQNFVTQAPFPVHIRQNKQNLGVTRNFGNVIQRCKGDIIALADQDDVWVPHKLTEIEAAFSRNPQAGLVFSNADVVDEQLHTLGYTLWETMRFNRHERRRVLKGDATDVLLRHNVVTGATLAFNARYKRLILPIEAGWIHDGWIALLIACAAPLAIIPEPLIKYRQHSDNQIGGLRKHLVQHQGDRSAYPAVYAKYQAVRQRLMHFEIRRDIPRIDEKLAHIAVRQQMSGDFSHRLYLASRELLKGRYHRYSGGMWSFFKDLITNPQSEETT